VGEDDSERDPVEEWGALEQEEQLVAEEQGAPTDCLEGPRSSREGPQRALPAPERGGFHDQMDPSDAIHVPKRQMRWGLASTNWTTFGKAGRRLWSSRTGRYWT
jgi:hypothetical protein